MESDLQGERFPMRKQNWKLASAVAALILTSGCSQVSTSRATPSSTPTKTIIVSIDHRSVYTGAAAYLQSFLDLWQKNGFYAAGQKYFDYSIRSIIQKQGNPVLMAGYVKRLTPYSWVSADHFTVLVQLDLRFSVGFSEGDGGWGSGTNDRFFTFVRSSASVPYQMTLATGPPGPGDHSAVYNKAFANLQSFLASWQESGAYVAGRKYLDPSMWPKQKQGNPVLIAGNVKLVQPYSWVSADHFILLVDFDLRFSGNAGAWGNGINTRFVTFARSSASAPYQLTLATGP